MPVLAISGSGGYERGAGLFLTSVCYSTIAFLQRAISSAFLAGTAE
jgi:hypothetical protein